MSTPNPKQLEIAHACLKALNDINIDAAADLLAPEFKQQYFPTSFTPSHGKVESNKEEFVARTRLFSSRFELAFQPPLDVVHGVDKVVFHIKADGKVKASGKEFDGEYVLTFHFAGEKIVKLNEFVDTKYTSEFFAAQ
ncbi:hypothetical protein B0H11DRAFT_1899746 [Mycena galericulata]|nr:hypothetical protein B0H11DRAFT_1899746 [Mycena galericulata]